MLVHGTTVDLAGLGVIILGASGMGKSDLALRLIDGGALLVSDDQSVLSLRQGALWARAPETISGLLEVRGKGIVSCATKAATCLFLAVELVHEVPARMPDPSFWAPGDATWPRLPLIRLDGREASAAAKVRITLATTGNSVRLRRE
jgi:hypothetical protein